MGKRFMLSFHPGRNAIGSWYSSEDAEVVGANGDKTIIAKIDATRIVVSLELLAMSLGHNLVIYWFLQRRYSQSLEFELS